MSYQPVMRINAFTPLARGILGAIAITGLSMVAMGVSLRIYPAPESPLTWGIAQAQDTDISSEEITNYAASVLAMDSHRTEAYTAIQNLLADRDHDISAVDLSCAGTSNLNQLPRDVRAEVRTIVVNYCNRASTIVESNGLTVSRFNLITAAYPQDPGLAEQIRTALIQIQQRSSPDNNSAPAE